MPKDFVYKTVSILLNKEIEENNNKENRKRKIIGKILLVFKMTEWMNRLSSFTML